MTPLDQLTQVDGRYQVEGSLVSVSDQQQVLTVEQAGVNCELVHWQIGMPIDSLSEGIIVRVPMNISMRDAVEIRYHTKQYLLLEKQQKLVGVLGDHNFYHALLGKHFNRNEVA